MQKSRRGFVRDLGGLVVGVSVIPFLPGCEDYGTDEPGGGNEGNGNLDDGDSEFKFTKPFCECDFSFGEVEAKEDGHFSYNKGVSGNAYSYFVVDNLHQGVSGAQVFVYDQLNVPGLGMASVIDPSGEFMPRSFELPFTEGMKGMDGRWMVLDRVKDAVKNGKARVRNYFDNALPSWN